jgi:uncharacterized protein
MIMGDLDTGFDLEAASRILNVGAVTEDECRNCWAFRSCTLCAKKADNNDVHLSSTSKLENCDETRADAYSRLKFYLLMKEIPLFYQEQTRAKEKKEGEVI